MEKVDLKYIVEDMGTIIGYLTCMADDKQLEDIGVGKTLSFEEEEGVKDYRVVKIKSVVDESNTIQVKVIVKEVPKELEGRVVVTGQHSSLSNDNLTYHFSFDIYYNNGYEIKNGAIKVDIPRDGVSSHGVIDIIEEVSKYYKGKLYYGRGY